MGILLFVESSYYRVIIRLFFFFTNNYQQLAINSLYKLDYDVFYSISVKTLKTDN